MADLSLHQWQNTHAVNLTGSFLLCRKYLRALRTAPEAAKRTANIVVIGSTAGKFGEAGHADYATSKSGLMYGFTNTLKNEIVRIAPQARVDSVNSGWVSTPLSAKALQDASAIARATSTVSSRKVAKTEDIARQIAVLSSPVMSGHISGMNVMVDGGMEGKLLFPAGALCEIMIYVTSIEYPLRRLGSSSSIVSVTRRISSSDKLVSTIYLLLQDSSK